VRQLLHRDDICSTACANMPYCICNSTHNGATPGFKTTPHTSLPITSYPLHQKTLKFAPTLHTVCTTCAMLLQTERSTHFCRSLLSLRNYTHSSLFGPYILQYSTFHSVPFLIYRYIDNQQLQEEKERPDMIVFLAFSCLRAHEAEVMTQLARSQSYT